MDRLLYRPKEVAELLSISRTRVYDLLKRGEIESIRVCNSIRVPRESLLSWIDQKRRAEDVLM